MAQQTSNFGFTKPDPNDFYDVEIQNENWDKVDEQMIPCFAKLYPYDSGKSADELTEPMAIIPISSSVNSELHSVFGGGAFAWVRTNFYNDAIGTVANKTQIAVSHGLLNPKMAFRTYDSNNGWTPWKGITTTDHYTYGTTDLTAGESDLATGTLYFVYE